MSNLCVKWETQSSAFLESISKIHLQGRFSDATIICQGRYFPVHRIVLSSCSLYFEEIFEKITSQHPVIVFTDIEPLKMELLLNFMYQGEAEVEQENFMSFMKTGEALKIKGINVEDVFSCNNKFFNKKRKRAHCDNQRSKRRLKAIRDTPSLPPLDSSIQDDVNDNAYTSLLHSGIQDEVNNDFYSSGNNGPMGDNTDELDIKDIVKEELPYFDDDKESELITESFTKSSLSNQDTYDNLDNSQDNKEHIEQNVAKSNENLNLVDNIKVKMGNDDTEAHPSVSSDVNNDQERLLTKKKKTSAQKGKNSSKFSPKNIEETFGNMDNVLHNHVPLEGKPRRRCFGCAKKGMEKRTRLFCTDCQLPFCKECFTLWHLHFQLNSIWE